MPIVERYTFLGHVGLVAKLGSFSPDRSACASKRTWKPLSSPAIGGLRQAAVKVDRFTFDR